MDFSEVVFCVHYANASSFSHGLMAVDWLFLRLFNTDFSCNVRLLLIFLCGVVTETRSCSVRVKKLVKVGLSEGGGVQLDFLLKGGEGGGGVVMNVIATKMLC